MGENLARQEKARAKLRKALMDLCEEQRYCHVTVNDICERAGVYRSTFYRYYDNKDALLREMELEYITASRRLAPHLCGKTGHTHLYLDELIADMNYHLAHRKLFLFLASPNGDPFFSRTTRRGIAEGLRNSLEKCGYMLTDVVNYVVDAVANTFMVMLYEWLKMGTGTAEEIARFQLTLVEEVPVFLLNRMRSEIAITN